MNLKGRRSKVFKKKRERKRYKVTAVFAPGFDRTSDCFFALCACACNFVSLPATNAGGRGVAESIERIEKLLNTSVEFHQLDLLDKPGLEKLFQEVRRLHAFISFA